MKILFIEDQVYFLEAITHILKKNNYSVDTATDGEEGLDLALTDNYSIIILDIMLPKINGIEVLKKIRSNNISTPVLLLTAKGETSDKVIGLDSGADDYLPKPFQTDELLARLRALGRRKSDFIAENIISFSDIELNPHTLNLYVNKNSYSLTLKESQILELLISNQNNILSSSTIIEKVWGYDSDAEDSNVQVYISFLRKKLSKLHSSAKIKTIRGAGYTLVNK